MPGRATATVGMRLVIGALDVLVLTASLWQGRYALDPHHWGLMLSNAADLAAGKMPYRDIFIQYGFLTTALQALAFEWLDGTLLSVLALTTAMYVAGYCARRGARSRPMAGGRR